MKKIQLIVLGLIVLLSNTNSFAAALQFWDANGSVAGSTTGGGVADGTWGVDPFWTTNANGTTATSPWVSGDHAVFAAGEDAFGSYTVNVDGIQTVGDMHVDSGQVTFQGGGLNLDAGGVRLLSVGHKDENSVARFNVVLSGATNAGIIRYKQGVLIFAATNTYAGSTTIEGGILRLGASHVIPTNSMLILANNDTTRPDFNSVWQFTPATLETDGFSQKLGALKLTGNEPSVQRVIDFGSGTSALEFANSSAEDWGGHILNIVNYTPGSDTLRFGNDNTGLTLAQLELMRFPAFFDLPGRIDSNGFVTPALPVFLSVKRTTATDVELTWSSVSGHNYRVQYKNDLNATTWSDLPFDVFATGDTANYTDTTATEPNRFYQILVLN